MEGNNEKKEKKEEKKEGIDKVKEKNPNQKEYFLYFVETHPEDIKLNIDLIENKHAKDLEKIKEESIKVLEEAKYYTLNKVKITSSQDLKSLEIKFKLTDSNDNKFKSEIKLKDFPHDIFYYDFNYTPEKGSKKNYRNNLSHFEQFKIFLNYLENDLNLEQPSDEFNNLLLSIRKKLIIKEKIKEIEYYDLSLFFLAFGILYDNESILKILKDFELKKIKLDSSNYLSNSERDKISANFDKLENDPKLILKKDDKMKYKPELYLIILCYRLFLKNGKFHESLKIILKDEENKNEIYKNIVKYHELFEGITFEKEQVSQMVKASDNFRRIKRSLSNIVTIADYLEIILENLDHIIDVRNKR